MDLRSLIGETKDAPANPKQMQERYPDIPVRASYDWHRIPAPRIDRWTVAVDLGQANDSTAIAVLHHTVIPHDTWTPNRKAETWKQDRTQRFDLLHLQRLPLGLSYVDQMHRVAAIVARDPLANATLDLVFDQTGVGAAVCDIADAIGLRHSRVVITAGLETTQHGRTFHVPKGVLISQLESAMHTRELQVPEGIEEQETLKSELQDFQRHITASGRATWSARSGAHDDIVLACAIGIWFCTARPFTGIEELRI